MSSPLFRHFFQLCCVLVHIQSSLAAPVPMIVNDLSPPPPPSSADAASLHFLLHFQPPIFEAHKLSRRSSPSNSSATNDEKMNADEWFTLWKELAVAAGAYLAFAISVFFTIYMLFGRRAMEQKSETVGTSSTHEPGSRPSAGTGERLQSSAASTAKSGREREHLQQMETIQGPTSATNEMMKLSDKQTTTATTSFRRPLLRYFDEDFTQETQELTISVRDEQEIVDTAKGSVTSKRSKSKSAVPGSSSKSSSSSGSSSSGSSTDHSSSGTSTSGSSSGSSSSSSGSSGSSTSGSSSASHSSSSASVTVSVSSSSSVVKVNKSVTRRP